MWFRFGGAFGSGGCRRRSIRLRHRGGVSARDGVVRLDRPKVCYPTRHAVKGDITTETQRTQRRHRAAAKEYTGRDKNRDREKERAG